MEWPSSNVLPASRRGSAMGDHFPTDSSTISAKQWQITASFRGGANYRVYHSLTIPPKDDASNVEKMINLSPTKLAYAEAVALQSNSLQQAKLQGDEMLLFNTQSVPGVRMASASNTRTYLKSPQNIMKNQVHAFQLIHRNGKSQDSNEFKQNYRQEPLYSSQQAPQSSQMQNTGSANVQGFRPIQTSKVVCTQPISPPHTPLAQRVQSFSAKTPQEIIQRELTQGCYVQKYPENGHLMRSLPDKMQYTQTSCSLPGYGKAASYTQGAPKPLPVGEEVNKEKKTIQNHEENDAFMIQNCISWRTSCSQTYKAPPVSRNEVKSPTFSSESQVLQVSQALPSATSQTIPFNIPRNQTSPRTQPSVPLQEHPFTLASVASQSGFLSSSPSDRVILLSNPVPSYAGFKEHHKAFHTACSSTSMIAKHQKNGNSNVCNSNQCQRYISHQHSRSSETLPHCSINFPIHSISSVLREEKPSDSYVHKSNTHQKIATAAVTLYSPAKSLPKAFSAHRSTSNSPLPSYENLPSQSLSNLPPKIAMPACYASTKLTQQQNLSPNPGHAKAISFQQSPYAAGQPQGKQTNNTTLSIKGGSAASSAGNTPVLTVCAEYNSTFRSPKVCQTLEDRANALKEALPMACSMHPHSGFCKTMHRCAMPNYQQNIVPTGDISTSSLKLFQDKTHHTYTAFSPSSSSCASTRRYSQAQESSENAQKELFSLPDSYLPASLNASIHNAPQNSNSKAASAEEWKAFSMSLSNLVQHSEARYPYRAGSPSSSMWGRVPGIGLDSLYPKKSVAAAKCMSRAELPSEHRMVGGVVTTAFNYEPGSVQTACQGGMIAGKNVTSETTAQPVSYKINGNPNYLSLQASNQAFGGKDFFLVNAALHSSKTQGNEAWVGSLSPSQKSAEDLQGNKILLGNADSCKFQPGNCSAYSLKPLGRQKTAPSYSMNGGSTGGILAVDEAKNAHSTCYNSSYPTGSTSGYRDLWQPSRYEGEAANRCRQEELTRFGESVVMTSERRQNTHNTQSRQETQSRQSTYNTQSRQETQSRQSTYNTQSRQNTCNTHPTYCIQQSDDASHSNPIVQQSSQAAFLTGKTYPKQSIEGVSFLEGQLRPTYNTGGHQDGRTHARDVAHTVSPALLESCSGRACFSSREVDAERVATIEENTPIEAMPLSNLAQVSTQSSYCFLSPSKERLLEQEKPCSSSSESSSKNYLFQQEESRESFIHQQRGLSSLTGSAAATMRMPPAIVERPDSLGGAWEPAMAEKLRDLAFGEEKKRINEREIVYENDIEETEEDQEDEEGTSEEEEEDDDEEDEEEEGSASDEEGEKEREEREERENEEGAAGDVEGVEKCKNQKEESPHDEGEEEDDSENRNEADEECLEDRDNPENSESNCLRCESLLDNYLGRGSSSAERAREAANREDAFSTASTLAYSDGRLELHTMNTEEDKSQENEVFSESWDNEDEEELFNDEDQCAVEVSREEKTAPNSLSLKCSSSKQAVGKGHTQSSFSKSESHERCESSGGGYVPIVNTRQAKAEKPLINTCIRSLGWKRHDACSIKGSILWLGGAIQDHEHIQYIKTSQIINRFPGLWDYTKKRMLSAIMKLCGDLFPDCFNFIPEAWELPGDFKKLRELLHPKNKTPYILKPDGGAMGHGVQLISRFSDIDERIIRSNRSYIVQRYIGNPFLLDRRKFDLRIYVLLTSVISHPQAFISKLGMVRFCTEEYQLPGRQNFGNPYMHLTNYSINKDNYEKYIRANDIHDKSNSKRLLADIFRELEAEGVDSQKIWKQIKEICAKTMIGLYPWLNLRYRQVYQKKKGQKSSLSQCFQLLGLDILIDDTQKAWLLEVNANPSLRIDYFDSKYNGIDIQLESPSDRYIKEPMLTEALMIVKKYLLDPKMRRIKNHNNANEKTWLKTPGRSALFPARTQDFHSLEEGIIRISGRENNRKHSIHEKLQDSVKNLPIRNSSSSPPPSSFRSPLHSDLPPSLSPSCSASFSLCSSQCSKRSRNTQSIVGSLRYYEKRLRERQDQEGIAISHHAQSRRKSIRRGKLEEALKMKSREKSESFASNITSYADSWSNIHTFRGGNRWDAEENSFFCSKKTSPIRSQLEDPKNPCSWAKKRSISCPINFKYEEKRGWKSSVEDPRVCVGSLGAKNYSRASIATECVRASKRNESGVSCNSVSPNQSERMSEYLSHIRKRLHSGRDVTIQEHSEDPRKPQSLLNRMITPHTRIASSPPSHEPQWHAYSPNNRLIEGQTFSNLSRSSDSIETNASGSILPNHSSSSNSSRRRTPPSTSVSSRFNEGSNKHEDCISDGRANRGFPRKDLLQPKGRGWRGVSSSPSSSTSTSLTCVVEHGGGSSIDRIARMDEPAIRRLHKELRLAVEKLSSLNEDTEFKSTHSWEDEGLSSKTGEEAKRSGGGAFGSKSHTEENTDKIDSSSCSKKESEGEESSGELSSRSTTGETLPSTSDNDRKEGEEVKNCESLKKNIKICEDTVENERQEVMRFMEKLNVLGLRITKSETPESSTIQARRGGRLSGGNLSGRFQERRGAWGSSKAMMGRKEAGGCYSANKGLGGGFGRERCKGGKLEEPPVQKISYAKIHKDELEPLASSKCAAKNCWISLGISVKRWKVILNPLTQCQRFFETIINFPEQKALGKIVWIDLCRTTRVLDILKRVSIPIIIRSLNDERDISFEDLHLNRKTGNYSKLWVAKNSPHWRERRRNLGIGDLELLYTINCSHVQPETSGLGFLNFWKMLEDIGVLCFPYIHDEMIAPTEPGVRDEADANSQIIGMCGRHIPLLNGNRSSPLQELKQLDSLPPRRRSMMRGASRCTKLDCDRGGQEGCPQYLPCGKAQRDGEEYQPHHQAPLSGEGIPHQEFQGRKRTLHGSHFVSEDREDCLSDSVGHTPPKSGGCYEQQRNLYYGREGDSRLLEDRKGGNIVSSRCSRGQGVRRGAVKATHTCTSSSKASTTKAQSISRTGIRGRKPRYSSLFFSSKNTREPPHEGAKAAYPTSRSRSLCEEEGEEARRKNPPSSAQGGWPQVESRYNCCFTDHPHLQERKGEDEEYHALPSALLAGSSQQPKAHTRSDIPYSMEKSWEERGEDLEEGVCGGSRLEEGGLRLHDNLTLHIQPISAEALNVYGVQPYDIGIAHNDTSSGGMVHYTPTAHSRPKNEHDDAGGLLGAREVWEDSTSKHQYHSMGGSSNTGSSDSSTHTGGGSSSRGYSTKGCSGSSAHTGASLSRKPPSVRGSNGIFTSSTLMKNPSASQCLKNNGQTLPSGALTHSDTKSRHQDLHCYTHDIEYFDHLASLTEQEIKQAKKGASSQLIECATPLNKQETGKRVDSPQSDSRQRRYTPMQNKMNQSRETLERAAFCQQEIESQEEEEEREQRENTRENHEKSLEMLHFSPHLHEKANSRIIQKDLQAVLASRGMVKASSQLWDEETVPIPTFKELFGISNDEESTELQSEDTDYISERSMCEEDQGEDLILQYSSSSASREDDRREAGGLIQKRSDYRLGSLENTRGAHHLEALGDFSHTRRIGPHTASFKGNGKGSQDENHSSEEGGGVGGDCHQPHQCNLSTSSYAYHSKTIRVDDVDTPHQHKVVGGNYVERSTLKSIKALDAALEEGKALGLHSAPPEFDERDHGKLLKACNATPASQRSSTVCYLENNLLETLGGEVIISRFLNGGVRSGGEAVKDELFPQERNRGESHLSQVLLPSISPKNSDRTAWENSKYDKMHYRNGVELRTTECTLKGEDTHNTDTQHNGAFSHTKELPSWYNGLCDSWPNIQAYKEEKIESHVRLEAVMRLMNFIKKRINEE